MIIDSVPQKEDSREAFETFDCPECNIQTELCVETKKALLVYYNDTIIKKIEEKKEEVREEEEIVKSQKRQNSEKNIQVKIFF